MKKEKKKLVQVTMQIRSDQKEALAELAKSTGQAMQRFVIEALDAKGYCASTEVLGYPEGIIS